MRATRLKTEYLQDPIGIGCASPRLFWNCADGVKQTAYRILAADASGAVLWDSGKVESDSMRANWGGRPLQSRDRVFWRVRLWDEREQAGAWSEAASFELGLICASDWQAEWIAGSYSPKRRRRYPVDCFKKEFAAQAVREARLYITACGLYEARLNGSRVNGFVLAPGVTDYTRRIQVQAYDVTALLLEGENTLEVWLADGWYRGSTGAWGLRNQYGAQTKLLAQLELTCANSSVTTVCTDGTWRWSSDGPIRFADNQDGEIVDARMSPSYAGHAAVTHCSVVPTASDSVPVTEQERLSPKLLTTPAGMAVLDFGQNIAGYVSFRLNGKSGDRLRLRFGEMLDEHGEFTQKNIQCSNRRITTPLQRVDYTFRDGVNAYKTTFAVFGFRYVLAEGDVPFSAEDFTAIAVYSDLEQTLRFESSSTLLNQFVQCTLWGAKGNSLDLPTDCPTRERHGWTGDAQIFCGTASYLFDYMPFARKYLRDVYDWQRKDGCLPQIAPEGGVDGYMKFLDGSVGWADAGVLMPYRLYRQYGDEAILRDNYEGMARYARFMQKRCGRWHPLAKRTGVKGEAKRYLSNYGQAYGEWAEPADVHPMTWKDCVIPHPDVATAYTCHVMDRMAEIAALLGKDDDAAQYARFAAGNRRAYQALMRTKAYSLDTDRQARLVRPLAFSMLGGEQAEYAKKRLVLALERCGWRLGTGFLSTPLILGVLSDIDIEYAYKLLENEEMPGWLFMPKNGATTVWEAWEGTKAQSGIASLNHYSKGAVCEWLFSAMCGINVSGENSFVVAPRPGGSFTYAKAAYQSVYGLVESAWERESDGRVRYTVTIPGNCHALVRLPDGTETEQYAGTQTYDAAAK